MIRLDTGYIFQKAGGVKGLLDGLDEYCPDHGLAYSTMQMWKQRSSIPSAWIGAVLYVMTQRGVPLAELLIDADELCGS
jgi:hypothetical protein